MDIARLSVTVDQTTPVKEEDVRVSLQLPSPSQIAVITAIAQQAIAQSARQSARQSALSISIDQESSISHTPALECKEGELLQVPSHSPTKRKRKHRKKSKKRRRRRRKRNKCGRRLRKLFPRQPLYLWASLTALLGLLIGSISFAMPWLEGTATCIKAGENAAKPSATVHAFDVFEPRIITLVQIGASMLSLLLICKHASSKMKQFKLIAPFLVYLLAVYLVSLTSGSIDSSVTNQAKADYESMAGETCSDSKFVLNAEFTIWKEAFVTSILLTLTSGAIAIFRSLFFAHKSRRC